MSVSSLRALGNVQADETPQRLFANFSKNHRLKEDLYSRMVDTYLSAQYLSPGEQSCIIGIRMSPYNL